MWQSTASNFTNTFKLDFSKEDINTDNASYQHSFIHCEYQPTAPSTEPTGAPPGCEVVVTRETLNHFAVTALSCEHRHAAC